MQMIDKDQILAGKEIDFPMKQDAEKHCDLLGI